MGKIRNNPHKQRIMSTHCPLAYPESTLQTENNLSQEEGPTYPSPPSASSLSSHVVLKIERKMKGGSLVIKMKKEKDKHSWRWRRNKELRQKGKLRWLKSAYLCFYSMFVLALIAAVQQAARARPAPTKIKQGTQFTWGTSPKAVWPKTVSFSEVTPLGPNHLLSCIHKVFSNILGYSKLTMPFCKLLWKQKKCSNSACRYLP